MRFIFGPWYERGGVYYRDGTNEDDVSGYIDVRGHRGRWFINGMTSGATSIREAQLESDRLMTQQGHFLCDSEEEYDKVRLLA